MAKVRNNEGMNMNTNRKPSSHLTNGDVFSYRDEVGTFISWNAPARDSRLGVYRQANVVNADGRSVVWSLNQAGSVALLSERLVNA